MSLRNCSAEQNRVNRTMIIVRKLRNKLKLILPGKKISSVEQAKTIISTVYSKYNKDGLKGVRLLQDPKNPKSVQIKVSASMPEVVANLPLDFVKDAVALADIAAQFDYLNPSTSLYVFYDKDKKPFGGRITNQDNNIHAEMAFKRFHLANLKAQIAADRKNNKLKTKKGSPVRVELNLNRIPCPLCSPILSDLASSNKDLQFVVKASSISNTTNFEVAADYIAEMIENGIIVEPLDIWKAIKKKFIEMAKKVGAGEIAFGKNSNNFVKVESIAKLIEPNLSKEMTVADAIKRAKQIIEEKKKKKDNNQSMGKVPPKGTGV